MAHPSASLRSVCLPDRHGRQLCLALTPGSAPLLRVMAVLKSRAVEVEHLRYDANGDDVRLVVTAVTDGESADRLGRQLARIVDVLSVTFGDAAESKKHSAVGQSSSRVVSAAR